MYFGREVWDPLLIISQILSAQFCFYSVICLWLLLLCSLGGHKLSLSLLFSAKSVSLDHTSVWVTILAHVFAIPVSAFLISRLVERMNKCVDFCLTLFCFHLFFCAVSYGMPTQWEWWALQVGSVVALIELTAYLCAELESAEIVMPYHAAAKKKTPQAPPSETASLLPPTSTALLHSRSSSSASQALANGSSTPLASSSANGDEGLPLLSVLVEH